MVNTLSGETMVPLHASIHGKCKHRSHMHLKDCLIRKRTVMACCDIGACMHVFILTRRWHQTVGHRSRSIAMHA